MDERKVIHYGKSLADQVSEHILSFIIENQLEAGSKLPNEFELAQKLKVSRSTVRESIKILVSKKIVEIRRGSGTFVSEHQGIIDDPLGLAFIRDQSNLALDLLEVRLMLEPQIAERAAKNATKGQIEALVAQCDKVELMIVSGQEYMDEDIILHKMIASCTGNLVVEKLVPIINSSIAVFMDVTSGKLRNETIQTHRQVVDGIKDGDSESAKYGMMMHLIHNRDMILQIKKNSRMV